MLADPSRPFIGTASLAGYIRQDGGSMATYALRVGNNDLTGLYACVKRQFVPLDRVGR